MGIDIAAEKQEKQVAQRKQVEKQKKKETFEKGAAAFKQGFLHKDNICTKCGTMDKPKKYTKGHFSIELVLWIAGILLAIFTLGISLLVAFIYSLWRIFSKYKACPSCHGEMINIHTPRGKQLVEQFHHS